MSQVRSTARRRDAITSPESKSVIRRLKKRSESVSPTGARSARGSSSEALQDRAVVAVGVRAARERMRVLQGQPADRRATHVHHDQPRPSAGELVERLVRMRRLREAVHLLAVLGVVDAAPAGVVRLGLAQDGVVGAQQLEGDVDRVARGCGEEPAHGEQRSTRSARPRTTSVPTMPSRDGPGRCRPSRTGPG